MIDHDLECPHSRAGELFYMNGIATLAVIHEHRDSVLALRIVFSILLAIVFFSGVYIFRIRKRLFDRDPQVTGDNYGARNLRLWQVLLVWILAMDLLIMALIKLGGPSAEGAGSYQPGASPQGSDWMTTKR